jgi:hypothetical protein
MTVFGFIKNTELSYPVRGFKNLFSKSQPKKKLPERDGTSVCHVRLKKSPDHFFKNSDRQLLRPERQQETIVKKVVTEWITET